jgi:hypothetical protein
MAISALMLLVGAHALWPATRAPVELDLLVSIVTAFIALGWQFYAVRVHRQTLGSWMTWLVTLLPLAGAVASSGGRADWGMRIYAAITGALIGSAFLWHHRRELPQNARDIWRIVAGLYAGRMWPPRALGRRPRCRSAGRPP